MQIGMAGGANAQTNSSAGNTVVSPPTLPNGMIDPMALLGGDNAGAADGSDGRGERSRSQLLFKL